MGNSHEILIVGKPLTKPRPRFGSGRTYTPKYAVEAQNAISDSWDGPCYEGPVRVSTWFNKDATSVLVEEVDWESDLRGDGDNYMKLVWDALNGVAYTDDRQVVAWLGEKR